MTPINVDSEYKCILQLINKIVEDENLISFEVKLAEQNKKGENYIGDVGDVLVKGQRNRENIEINLVWKIAPTTALRRKAFNCNECFQREIRMYENVFPLFNKFQRERSSIEYRTAKVYATCKIEGCETLLMEDMKSLGYKLKSRTEVMDIDHYKAVMYNLAHLHSISYALKDQCPDIFSEFLDLSETVYRNEVFTDTVLDGIFERINICFNDEINSNIKKYISFLRSNFIAYLSYCTSSEDTKKYGVVGHGDTWSNNIFFQYKDENNRELPTSVCFIDWQLSRYASPILDIVYFLYTSTDKDFRTNHLQDLYEEYYKYLSEHLRKLGTKIQNVLPYKAFQEEIRKFQLFGCITGLTLLHFVLARPEEAINPDEMIASREIYTQVFMQKAKHDIEYRKRMKDLTLELYEIHQKKLL